NKILKKSLIPGRMQFQRKQYWKLPLIYGGISSLFVTSQIFHNEFEKNRELTMQKNYQLPFSNAYSTLKYTDFPGYHYPDNTTLNADYLKYINDSKKFKTLRNLSYVGIGTVYLFNLADAIAPVNKEFHSPYKAALLSAIIPGLGQIYNGEYWKLPLIYSIFAGAGYFIKYENDVSNLYKEAYFLRTEYPNFTEMYFAYENAPAFYSFSESDLLQTKDYFKRWRTVAIFTTLGAYLANILDATVFAYLKSYDVSDDISLNLFPLYSEQATNFVCLGLQANIKF
ncbi:DUF5683 domain-containing protein, partial [Bacteroidota bacterium]